MGPDQGPDKQQAVVEAVMSKGIERTTPPASEEQKVARAMRLSLDQGNAREALKIATEPEVDNKNLSKRIEQIGVERDNAGKKTRTPEEQQRYDRAKDALDISQRFLKEGFDKLSTAEQTSIKATVIEQINKNPVLAEKYRNMTADEQRDYVLALVKDPQNAEKAREILSEVGKGPELLDLVADAKDKVSEKTLERDIKAEEVADVQRRSDAVDARLRDFERPAGGGALGEKAKELDKLKTDLPQMEARISQLTITGQGKAGELQRLQQEYAASLSRTANPNIRDSQTLAGLITQAEGELVNIQNEVAKLNGDIAKIAAFEEEEKVLERSKKDIGIEMREAKLELGKKELDLAKVQREYDDALSLRESQEMDIVNGLEGVFANAAIEVLNKRVEEAYHQFDTSLKELRDKATTSAEKAIIDAIEIRHKRVITVRRFGRTEQQAVIDKAKNFRDFNLLMKDGSEAYMKALISGAKNPETNVLYTPDEVEKLMENKELMEKMQPEAIKELIAKRLMIGKISEGDAYFITTSKWGEEMLDKAITTNQNFRDTINRLGGEGVIDNPGFMKRFGREVGAASLLSLILAGVVSAPVLSALAAAKEGNKIYR